MSDTMASLRCKTGRAGDLPGRLAHDEGPSHLEHRPIRSIGACLGRRLSERGTGLEPLFSEKCADADDGERSTAR